MNYLLIIKPKNECRLLTDEVMREKYKGNGCYIKLSDNREVRRKEIKYFNNYYPKWYWKREIK